MSDLIAEIDQLFGNTPDGRYGYTNSCYYGEDELRARLKYYETATPGFEATEEHLEVMKAIFSENRNVFITGGAGVGKTMFVKSVLMPELDYRNLHWAVTATTGIAGSHLDGKTLHSFFGIQMGPDWIDIYPRDIVKHYEEAIPGEDTPRPQDMSQKELQGWYAMFFERWMTDPRIRNHTRQGVMARLRSHELVIIDEVSMLPGAGLLGYLDYMLKAIRENDKPFGGLQLVMIGDFCQLPPVEKGNHKGVTDWAFLSTAWQEANVKPIELTKVFRQGDTRFIEFLNNVRVGLLTPEDREYMQRFVRNDLTVEETRYYTFLLPTNEQAGLINRSVLLQYDGPTRPLDAVYQVVPELQGCKDWERRNPEDVKKGLTKALTTRLLDTTNMVRIGYPVMFTVNDSDGRFVNGTRGFVRSVSISGSIEDDTVVVGVPNRNKGAEEELIVVRRYPFTRTRDESPFEMIDVPSYWNADPARRKLPEKITAHPSIWQFPLIPAAGITIHKSQGATLDRAILALARTFAAGHVYVGLSRLSGPEGLVLSDSDFQPLSDPIVMEYYRHIREARAK